MAIVELNLLFIIIILLLLPKIIENDVKINKVYFIKKFNKMMNFLGWYKVKFSEPYQVACLGKVGKYYEYYNIKPDPSVYKPKIERMIEEAYKLGVDCVDLMRNYKRHYRTDDQNFEEVYNDLCEIIGDLGKVEDKLKTIREKHGDGY